MNHNPATERELGLLHKLIAELHKRRLQRMLDQMDDPEDPIKPEYAIDEKYLRIAQKFLTDNHITAMPDSQDRGSGVSRRVDEIKKRMSSSILDFQQEARERGKG